MYIIEKLPRELTDTKGTLVEESVPFFHEILMPVHIFYIGFTC